MNNISITLNNDELEIAINKLKEYEVCAKSETILHLYKFQNATITIFKTRVLLIQGQNSQDVYENIFDKKYIETDVKEKNEENNSIFVNQNKISTMGSDEVGVGDFFGGLVVAACFVRKDQIDFLKDAGVKDSKSLSDQKIMDIFEKIKDEVAYNFISINPTEYNAMFSKYNNSHIIKAVLHNQCLWNLSKEVNRPYFVIVDQFAEKGNYSQYLRKANKTEFTVDIFETKAESKYLAVACASIIARAIFINQIKELEQAYNVELVLGSSNEKIKSIGKEIIQNHGLQALMSLCKNHFITYKEIVEESYE